MPGCVRTSTLLHRCAVHVQTAERHVRVTLAAVAAAAGTQSAAGLREICADEQVMLRKESDWMARQPKARGTKAKARVDSFYELQEKAKSGPRRDVLVNLGEVSMARQGKKVLVMEVRRLCTVSQSVHVALHRLQALKLGTRHLCLATPRALPAGQAADAPPPRLQECSKVWDGRKLIDSFSYDFAPGERLGLVGPNGSGKTTLLDMLSGRLALDEGHRELGETSVVGYFAQHPPEVNPRLKVIDYLVDVSDKACAAALARPVHAVRNCDHFMHRFSSFFLYRETTDVVGLDIDPAKMLAMLGFPYERHQQYVSSLSGGERRRLHLASVLVTKPNFLILDEPTNDLDLATIEVPPRRLAAPSRNMLCRRPSFLALVAQRTAVLQTRPTVSLGAVPSRCKDSALGA